MPYHVGPGQLTVQSLVIVLVTPPDIEPISLRLNESQPCVTR